MNNEMFTDTLKAIQSALEEKYGKELYIDITIADTVVVSNPKTSEMLEIKVRKM